MKRRIALLLPLLALLGAPVVARAAVTYGSHVDGLRNSFFSAASDGSNIRDTAGLAFDPSHIDTNGEYDRVFLANHEDSTAKSRRGVHLVDIFNETQAVRVARTGTNNPFDVIANLQGDIRTSYGYDNGFNSTNSPSVRKTLNPVSGAEVDSRLINSYGATTLNDPVGIAFVPFGFGGGFEPGEDVILFDQAYDSSNNESIVVVDKDSTHTSPLSSIVYSDGSGSSNSDFRGDASNVDGYAYFARLEIKTGMLSGIERPFIERVKGDGVLQRMFLDIDAGLMETTLDDALKVNQVDGSVWLPTVTYGSRGDGDVTTFHRIDVASASDQGGNDFLADVSQEITLTEADAYDIGVNSMAFSPDGKLLAVGSPENRDAMYVYRLTVQQASLVASVNTSTGEVILRNNSDLTIDFASYTLTSPMGALNLEGWNSLSDQSGVTPLVAPVDGGDPDLIAGSSSGESWTESIGSDASAIGELFLLGDTTLAPGEAISLGNAYDQSTPDSNITFEFLRANPATVMQGTVEFVDTLTGDYNGDNVVDAADYAVWRENLGLNVALPNESEMVTPGVVTSEDYVVWRNNYGLSLSSAATSGSTTAPEPTALVVLFILIGLAGGCVRRRRSLASSPKEFSATRMQPRYYGTGKGMSVTMNRSANQHRLAATALLTATIVLAGNVKLHAAADPIASEDSWTLAILPDTQHYVDNASNFPHFVAQTEWVKNHKSSHNIKFLLHEGDLIEDNDAIPSDPPNQWENARLAMDLLHDPNPALAIPYAITPGNHDMGANSDHGSTRDSEFSDPDKFGHGSPYANQPTIGGFYDPVRTENTFHTFQAGGQDWLVLALEFGPRSGVVDWANQIVEAHPDHQVMLLTHLYMDNNNTRVDWVANGPGSSQASKNPHSYGIANLPGGVNDGQELWDDLVSQHDNFRYVFSGHVPGVGQLASIGSDGNVVHQVLANYQHLSGGGLGYMRLLEFKPDGSVQVRTYSPSLDVHNRAFNEEFLLTPLNGLDGDLNQDALVDINDWLSFQNGSLVDLEGMTILERYALGDVDLDGDNDTTDFLLFRHYFDISNGAGAFASIASQHAPEPASIALVLLGVTFATLGQRAGRKFCTTSCGPLPRSCVKPSE